MSTDLDIAIVGAGPTGAALGAAARATRLPRRADWNGRWFDAPRVGESLAPATQPLLRNSGCGRSSWPSRPCPLRHAQRLGQCRNARSHSHLMSPYGCGWHVDRLAFDRMLAEAAVIAAGAELRCGTASSSAKEADDGWALTLMRLDTHR